MGQAVETITGSVEVTNNAIPFAVTPANGQSFAVRATNGISLIELESIWATYNDAGNLRIRSPRLHDDLNAINLQAVSGSTEVLTGDAFSQPLYSQDLLVVEAVFGAAPVNTHIQQMGMTFYYDDLPGVAANNRTAAAVMPNIVSYLSVPVTPISSATVGNYGQGVAINSSVDVFKANTMYALLGYITDGTASSVLVQGIDTGNLLVGGPGSEQTWLTRDWFVEMDEMTGKPSIPVINSQNKTGTQVFTTATTATVTTQVSLLFAQLTA